MTNEEAIAILKTAEFPEDYTVEEVKQAFDMAIRALKNEQTEMVDLINRVVDATKIFIERIKNMPNEEIEKIIVKNIKEQTDGDLISRKSVITMLNKIENAVEDGDGFQFNEWVEYAKDIPSAEKTTINPEKTTIKAE